MQDSGIGKIISAIIYLHLDGIIIILKLHCQNKQLSGRWKSAFINRQAFHLTQ